MYKTPYRPPSVSAQGTEDSLDSALRDIYQGKTPIADYIERTRPQQTKEMKELAAMFRVPYEPVDRFARKVIDGLQYTYGGETLRERQKQVIKSFMTGN